MSADKKLEDELKKLVDRMTEPVTRRLIMMTYWNAYQNTPMVDGIDHSLTYYKTGYFISYVVYPQDNT